MLSTLVRWVLSILFIWRIFFIVTLSSIKLMNKTIPEFLSGNDGVLSYLFEISDNELFLAHYLLPPTSAWCLNFSLQPTYYVFLWASGNLLLTNLPWVVCVLKSERGGKILLKIQHLQLLVEGVEKWEVEKTFGKKKSPSMSKL